MVKVGSNVLLWDSENEVFVPTPIEDIEDGDIVAAFDEITESVEPCTVRNVIKVEATDYYEVRHLRGMINCLSGTQFYVNDSYDWDTEKIDKIKQWNYHTMYLLDKDYEHSVIDNIKSLKNKTPEIYIGLDVEYTHNYFASTDGNFVIVVSPNS